MRPSRRPPIPQNSSADETIQALLNATVSRRFNIARLRPGDLPPGQRFETVRDVRERRDQAVGRCTAIEGLGFLAEQLESCTLEAPCMSVSCPRCGRKFRRWIVAQALPFYRKLDLQWVTVALELVPADRLIEVDLLKLKRRTSQRIRRTAPSASVVLGGIEAEYLADEDAFLVHGHFLISRLPKEEEAAFRAAFRKIDRAHPVRIDPLNDPLKQISYSFKYATYYRPGKQTGPYRPRPVPLPDGPLMDLSIWRAHYTFLDFVFMMGVRRRGGALLHVSQR
ncbi:hypothetical protein AMST5_03382 [freshwater sediment metagenome]|uniref:Uncharacterized protein n=1 Tax=freshwater sediment metagenome TaxID=556182 RepID=A0AA48RBH7_9ZZZZ